MSNKTVRQGAAAAASGGGCGRCSCKNRCRLAGLNISTPANCRRLPKLEVVSGFGEPDTELVITVGKGVELCTKTNEFGTFRVCVTEKLCPGFHEIVAAYQDAPECPSVRSWVYIDSPEPLPAPVIVSPKNCSRICETMPVIAGFAVPGNLVTATIAGTGKCVSAFAGRDCMWYIRFPRPFCYGNHTVCVRQQASAASVSEEACVTFAVLRGSPRD